MPKVKVKSTKMSRSKVKALTFDLDLEKFAQGQNF